MQQTHMGIARSFDFLLTGLRYQADNLSTKVVGNTKGTQEVCVETVDTAVLAAPLRGERNQCVHSFSLNVLVRKFNGHAGPDFVLVLPIVLCRLHYDFLLYFLYR